MNVVIKRGERIRTWGGWYRHDTVSLEDGRKIGTIQVRRRPKRRIEVITLDMENACVLGSDIAWLKRRAGVE